MTVVDAHAHVIVPGLGAEVRWDERGQVVDLGGKAIRAAVREFVDLDKILEEQDRTRVPELISIRHGRMLASPFTFYRGAAGIMAADLGVTPRSGLDVQLCGDAHLSNFGVFAAPDRRLIFDINDFDETFPGPF